MEKISYFTRLLTEKKQEILKTRMEKRNNQMQAGHTAGDDDVDQANELVYRNTELEIISRESNQIKQIEKALDKIRKGTFGLCEICHMDIEENRQLANPVTCFCFSCQEELEEKRKKL